MFSKPKFNIDGFTELVNSWIGIVGIGIVRTGMVGTGEIGKINVLGMVGTGEVRMNVPCGCW